MSEKQMKALYDVIKENIQEDGSLPEDFQLPKVWEKRSGIRWMDGAMDGVAYYHTGMEQERSVELEKAVWYACQGNHTKAQKYLDIFCEKNCMIDCVDTIQQYIKENVNKLNLNGLLQFGYLLIRTSDNVEEVKLGLVIMEMICPKIEEVREVIRTLAVSDEFTLFALYAIRYWDNVNEEVFRIAKATHGWGRIHAVELLEPENQEMVDWLLREGWNNEVQANYSAWQCCRKTNLLENIQKGLTGEECKKVQKLIVALFEDGPCITIYQMKNAKEIMKKYVQECKKNEVVEECKEAIREIQRLWRID